MRNYLWISFILTVCCSNNLLLCSVYCLDNVTNNTVWTKLGTTVGLIIRQCLVNDIENEKQTLNNFNPSKIIQECVKNKGSQIIGRILNRDVIEISKNVVLMRKRYIDDRSSNNQTGRTFYTFKTRLNSSNEFYNKILEFFKTRILKIKMNNLKFLPKDISRRKKNDGFGQLMLFGLVAAGFILIPLGFQFLAVLGGKALLLAKLALILSSIQGLKKIATSHVNYGLYSTGGNPGTSWYYDRQWTPESIEPMGYSSADSISLGNNHMSNLLSKKSSNVEN